jgi:hypothetical protein
VREDKKPEWFHRLTTTQISKLSQQTYLESPDCQPFFRRKFDFPTDEKVRRSYQTPETGQEVFLIFFEASCDPVLQLVSALRLEPVDARLEGQCRG